MARILGRKEFWSLPFRLSPDTLVPRPETETVVEAALDAVGGRRNDALRIADLGTGSGAILLALLHELPNAFGIGTDRRAPARSTTARANAARSATRRRAASCAAIIGGAARFLRSCGFKSALYREPPISLLCRREVRHHDPRLALDGGADGLDAYRAIAADARRILAPHGALVVELGLGQLAAVSGVMANAGLAPKGPVQPDIAGIPRALTLAVLS